MNSSTPRFPVLHYLLEFAQTHVHWVNDATQPSHPLSPPSPPALNLSQHQSFPVSQVFSSCGQRLGPQIQHQFCSLQSLSWVWLCDPMNHSTPGLPVHHKLLESILTHVHWVGDTIQPSHLLLSPSPPSLNLSQHQGLFKWLSSSHQVAKVLEF